jgi:hypothetical protein
MIEAQPWTVSLTQREAEFFSKIAPNLKNMLFPKGWWSGKSEKQDIAIMEDLTKSGCTFAPEAAAYPFEKVMNGVEQLAGLHAQYWGQSQEDHPCKEAPFFLFPSLAFPFSSFLSFPFFSLPPVFFSFFFFLLETFCFFVSPGQLLQSFD